MNTVLLMMGGSGSRMGGSIPKQYVEVNGSPVFLHIIDKYVDMPEISTICIVSNAEWIGFVNEVITGMDSSEGIIITEGGSNRSESIKKGLLRIKGISENNDVILIHDATHPYVDKEVVKEIIEAVKTGVGATAGGMLYDTCYQMNREKYIEKVVPRELLVSGASPEAFRFGDLADIYFTASDSELLNMTSAGAIALAHNIPMKVIPMRLLNLKLTFQQDMELYRYLAGGYY